MRLYVPESPRWLITHGYEDEADATVRDIEEKIKNYEDIDELPEPDDDDAMELRQRKSIGFVEIARTTFVVYPRRAVAGFSIMITQAFLYNAIFFTYGLMLTTFYDVSAAVVGFFLVPFAIGNFLGPLILGHWFDKVGRKAMIPGTFWLAGALTILTGFAFWQELFGSAWLLTVAWVVIFFFASAAASAGYLTVSETFPLEIRAMAIAFFYAMATAAGGIVGPFPFGNLITGGRASVFYGYLVAGGLMLLGGTMHRIFGIEAAQKGLEDIAAPLTAQEADEGGGGGARLTGPAGVDVTDRQAIEAFQREHDLARDAVVGPETMGALRAAADGDSGGEQLTVIDPTDAQSVRSFQDEYGLEPDGIIGPETQGAVRAAERRSVIDPTDEDSIGGFQRAHGLQVDGVLGPVTQAALRAVHARRVEGEAAAFFMAVDVLDPEVVKTFQRAVGLGDDGLVGARTRGALKLESERRRLHAGVDLTDQDSIAEFQRRAGLEADGIVGPRTRQALRERNERLRERRRRPAGDPGPGRATSFAEAPDPPRRRRRRLFGVDPLDAESVARFQREHQLKPDGCIGPETRRVLRRQRHLLVAVDPTDADSIREFQEEHGLEPDGVMGPETQGAIRALRAETAPAGIEEEDEDAREEADEEEKERTLVLFDPAEPDQVKDFQREHGLEPDGVIGPRTQGALAAVVRERELELQDSELPRPERRPRARRAGRAFVAMGGLGASSYVPGEDKDFQRELDQLLEVLGRGETMSRSQLREAVNARRWGPGRFRYVLRSAEEEGIVRRVGRDQYTRAGR